MKVKQHKRKADALIVLLLFGIFAVCILSVLLTGADAYRRLSQRDDASYDHRTASQYLSTRIRQSDCLDAVAIEDFEGTDALVFTETIDGVSYETRVYCYDGYLRELFTAAGGDFLPGDGEKVLKASSLTLRMDGQRILVELTSPAGDAQRLTLYLRSGEEVAK